MKEQLRNIIKFSQGTKIEENLLVENKKLLMKVADNGVGFNPDTVKDGIVLTNIRRPAELFYGKVNIDSSPGNGCKVTVDIPLQSRCVMIKCISVR